MGEPCGVDDVADGINIWLVGLAIVVDLDCAARIYDDFSVFEAEIFDGWHTADCDEQHFGFERHIGALVGFARNLDAFFDFSTRTHFEVSM